MNIKQLTNKKLKLNGGVKASVNVVDEACQICADVFDLNWEDEEKGWQLKNAVRVNGKAYYLLCCEVCNNENKKTLQPHIS